MDAQVTRDGYKVYRLVNLTNGEVEESGILGGINAKDRQNMIWKRVKTRIEIEKQLTKAEWEDAWKK